MYKLYNNLQLKIVENQDLYRNKDDFQLKKKKFLYFDLKYLYLVSKMYSLQNDLQYVCMYYVCIMYYGVYKMDYRERTAPKIFIGLLSVDNYTIAFQAIEDQ